jgi:hypothetical protein
MPPMRRRFGDARACAHRCFAGMARSYMLRNRQGSPDRTRSVTL